MNRYKYFLLILSVCIWINLPAQPAKAIAKNTISQYLTEKTWNELFPNRYKRSSPASAVQKQKKKPDFYSRKAFLEAVTYFPQFLTAADEEINKRELCAFLASMAYESGGGWDDAPGGYYTWGLYFTEERNCEKGCPQYSDPAKPDYPVTPGQSYHGRGPLQLSWNYNYGQFSEAFFGTKETLLKDPGLVATDPVLAFASAIWFWITPQYPKPSCHDIISNTWKPSAMDIAGGRLPGFGAVVNVINGGIECGKPPSAATGYRFGYYQFFCRYFKVSPGDNTTCSTQRPFGQ